MSGFLETSSPLSDGPCSSSCDPQSTFVGQWLGTQDMSLQKCHYMGLLSGSWAESWEVVCAAEEEERVEQVEECCLF